MATGDPHGTAEEATPTGWAAITGTPAVSAIVDTLLDLPAEREFNKSELAELAGVSRNTVGNHIDTLEAVGLVTEVSHAHRYRVDTDSPVFRAATELDVAVRDELRE
ncbi:winged helix-turn-helix domain-containing protein [Halobaculum sp. MBLA0147]|uniref:helix-turn-helix domain-containing protein n=1 Tax=Halobaculum sp. MBLA0147 TaxID=3079934 RepID=UPI003524D03D